MNATATNKQVNEQRAFDRFIALLGQQGMWIQVESRPEPEPDLLCTHIIEGQIAFELVSITDPRIAKIQAAGAKAYTDAFSTSDPTERIIRNKIHRQYKTAAPRIDLLVYTDGQAITPDNQIVLQVELWADAIAHPFAKIWYSGECEARLVWPVA